MSVIITMLHNNGNLFNFEKPDGGLTIYFIKLFKSALETHFRVIAAGQQSYLSHPYMHEG